MLEQEIGRGFGGGNRPKDQENWHRRRGHRGGAGEQEREHALGVEQKQRRYNQNRYRAERECRERRPPQKTGVVRREGGRLSWHEQVAGRRAKIEGTEKDLQHRVDNDCGRTEPGRDRNRQIENIVNVDLSGGVRAGAQRGFPVLAEELAQTQRKTTQMWGQCFAFDEVARDKTKKCHPTEIDSDHENGKWQARENREQQSEVYDAAQRLESLEIDVLVDGDADVAQYEPRKIDG